MKKYSSLALALVMAFCCTSVAFATTQNNAPSYDSCIADVVDASGTEYLFDPETNEYLPICHVEDEVAAISLKNGHDYEFETKFEQKRLSDALMSKGVMQVDSESNTPIPGGVGYGAYFTSDFQSDFTTGTTLFYNIICPSKAGGDVDDHLYLTSTNRAAKGVEAFISYYKQDNPYFKVYDWARSSTDRWQVSMTYDDLADYLTTKTISGVNRQCVTVQNRTAQSSSTEWKNIVSLKNYKTNSYDQVYTYTYKATLSDQRDSHYGSWGPIVETFQDSYNKDTNIIGFYNINLMSKTTAYSNNTWQEWELLTDEVSYIRNDKLGFSTVFLSPNYTFGVH